MKVHGRIGLGFMLNSTEIPMGPNPHPFGHPGAGGSIGFADPDAKVGFGYVMNQMSSAPPLDPRPRVLIKELYASL
jgi:CubicO group peptidase (beta-lactamase class C family)